MVERKTIKRKQPFEGIDHDFLPIKVLGPSIPYYQELLDKFRDIKYLLLEESLIEKSLLEEKTFTEHVKKLDDSTDKSSENNSSAVCLFNPNGNRYLFAGDAGPLSLKRIAAKFSNLTKGLYWLKVPHHGSINNLSHELINHFSPSISFISGDGSKKYPSQEIVKALKEVNSRVYSTHTRGTLRYSFNMGERDAYSIAEQL